MLKFATWLVLLLVVVGSWVVLTAASGLPDSKAIAGGLVLAWGFIAPLTVYKWIKLDDAAMKAVTMIATVVIAFLALLFSNGFTGIDFHSSAMLFTVAGLIYGEQQFVWTLFKDHPQTTRAVN